MRAFRRRRGTLGRLPSLGQDHHAGHRTYVEAIGNQRWLQTKPFSSPPNYELGRCLHGFAHIVDALHLGPGARVLDVGCGPGWLSEFLARCGYEVTGVDVSDDMVAIARSRIDAVSASLGDVAELRAEFHAMPVRELPWTDRFEAAVLYDAMHHFDEELETLRVIRRTLVPGGRIYIHEGVRPPAGSAGERELIEEMRQYGTLESPFDPQYLLQVVVDAGFHEVQRLVEVDRLVPAEATRGELRSIRRRLRAPETNTVIATNPRPDGGVESARTLAAELTLLGSSPSPDVVLLRIRAHNVGSRPWPAPTTAPPSPGSITVAPFVGEGRARRELGRVSLPWTVSPEQSVDLDLSVRRSELEGHSEVVVDLVAEEVSWFADPGTEPLRIVLPD